MFKSKARKEAISNLEAELLTWTRALPKTEPSRVKEVLDVIRELRYTISRL